MVAVQMVPRGTRAPSPIAFGSVALIFGGTLVPILLGVYVVLPYLVGRGLPFFVGYLLCFQTIPFVFIFTLALVLYRVEGNPFSWKAFVERMRLRLNIRTVFYGVGLFAVSLAAYALLQPVTRTLAGIPLLTPPAWFGPELNPLKSGAPGTFMGMSMAGAVWAVLVYLLGWFFNIAGEELLFRGYLLPRMEAAYGAKAWLIQAACWWAWHCFWRWQLVALAPIIFLLPLLAQKSRSTIPGIIAHGGVNLVGIVMIASMV